MNTHHINRANPGFSCDRNGMNPGAKFLWTLALALLVALGAVLWVVRHRTGGAAPTATRPDPQARVVPVTAAAVARRDVPVFLDGLGNVVAFRTVTVKTQVDGRLEDLVPT